VAFTVFEMGRLLPAPRAFNMSVEYEGVVVFGRARVLESEEEKRRGLGLLIEKYFAHLTPAVDYALPSVEELSLTSVYRIAIDSWSGKRKAVEADYAGAFRWAGTIHRAHRGHRMGLVYQQIKQMNQMGFGRTRGGVAVRCPLGCGHLTIGLSTDGTDGTDD
jgi:hypothetical protein